MKARVTLNFIVPAGYVPGDYAMLHVNDGEGDIDWDNPVSEEKQDLFPRGAGLYGYGHAPWGRFRWGHAHSMRCAGYGHLPYGKFPWGHGTAIVSFRHTVTECGYYRFGISLYDAAGNKHEGSPGEISLNIHIPPDAPAGLKKNYYNKTADELTLDVA